MSPHTSSRYELVHLSLQPGEEMNIHTLPMDVIFFVVEGTGELKIGEELVVTGENTTIHVGHDMPRAWSNSSKGPLKIFYSDRLETQNFASQIIFFAMAEKYQNKYRIPSARAPWWDYGWDAIYFVTICTSKRKHFFGEIVDCTDGVNKVQLSKIGKIANECWMEIPIHFSFVKLDAFVVMPNHVHGILVIDNTSTSKPVSMPVETQDFASLPSTATSLMHMETQNFASLPLKPPHTLNKFGPQSKNLGSIIRGYKIGVTTRARLVDPDFSWQTRFHDHIIRDDRSYKVISEYIQNNPAKWWEDKFFSKKIQT